MSDINPKRKCKGGAEKVRDKKLKILGKDGAKCRNLVDLFKATPIQTKDTGSQQTPSASKQPDTNRNDDNNQHSVQSVVPTNLIPTLHLENVTEPSELTDNTTLAVADLNAENDSSERVTETSVIDNKNTSYYFKRPRQNTLQSFFKFHPIQPSGSETDLPFTNAYRVFFRSNGINRNWVSYFKESKALFCTVCLAYGKTDDMNSFTTGMNSWKHVHQRIEEHENSKYHEKCVEAHLMSASGRDIDSILFSQQSKRRYQEVQEKRQVLERVIEILKMIGKRGLSYRSKNDAAYTLNDDTIDHGNFLEILLLLSKFDPIIKKHLDTVIGRSNDRHASNLANKGRGNLITLISKTTLNYIIDAMTKIIKKTISEEIKSAGMFSVQLDTTQDVSVKDQCSIIIRYVTDKVHERLICVANCTSSTGKGMFELFQEKLIECNINIEYCVGNATDGAANMQGQYNGFTKWLSDVAPHQIHVWCYAHVLNLVLSDTTQTTTSSISLFQLLNACAVFFRESYKRMDVWVDHQQKSRHQRLNVIGETRWWAKESALKKVFGNFDDPNSSLFIELISTLQELAASDAFNGKIRDTAQTLLDKFIKFETVVTAKLYLRIFQHTGSLSNYLQTAGMDALQAYRNVDCTVKLLKNISRDFDGVLDSAKRFVSWANNKLEEKNVEITIEENFVEKRLHKPKVMSDERKTHEVVGNNAADRYRIEVHNCIMDKIVKTIEKRFESHDSLFADIACLDPQNFEDIKQQGLATSAMQRLSSILVKFDESATATNLREELTDFAQKWDKFKNSVPDEYLLQMFDDSVEDSVSESEDSPHEHWDDQVVDKSEELRKCKFCKKCPVCCFSVLHKYSFYGQTYKHLFSAYKLLLTLSSTQVACERSFSKLKYIKNRLRSSLSSTHLEAFMLMSTETDVLSELNNDTIIDHVAEMAPGLKKLLIL
jgi:hypothetical protein